MFGHKCLFLDNLEGVRRFPKWQYMFICARLSLIRSGKFLSIIFWGQFILLGGGQLSTARKSLPKYNLEAWSKGVKCTGPIM